MMMTWSRTRTLVAGIALIAITNAAALIGVAYNRNGDPESRLRLSQRELSQPYPFGLDRERTGLVLNLDWRVLPAETTTSYYPGSYGSPAWLDKPKLASLGFDVSRPAAAPSGARYYGRLLPREVLVVLELDGPAYRQALQRAQQRADDAAARAAASPGKAEVRPPVNTAGEQLKREQTSNSRLFAVDAGLDTAALREKYPDRSRYAIVRGSIRVQSYGGRGKDGELTGHIADLGNDRISVPPEFRREFESVPRTRGWGRPADAGLTPFQVTVAFGKRLEPWIVAASAGKAQATPSK